MATAILAQFPLGPEQEPAWGHHLRPSYMRLFQRASFAISAATMEGLPTTSVAEIAFAGRSNAGKSSAINTLANHNRLAFVSKTPGRTQLLNYFDLGDQRYLVDLPGYGYAKVPAAVRAPWERLLGRYMLEREQLKGLALIMDIRHPFTEHDDRLLNWFAPSGKPVHILLTKSDKLSRTEANQVLQRLRKEVSDAGAPFTMQLFSSLKKSGLEEAEQVFAGWLDMPLPAAALVVPARPSFTRKKTVTTPKTAAKKKPLG